MKDVKLSISEGRLFFDMVKHMIDTLTKRYRRVKEEVEKIQVESC